MPTEIKPVKKNENVFLSLLFNVLLPVAILNRKVIFGMPVEPWQTLLISLSFPLGYFIYDFVRRKKANMISIFGLLNVLATGGFALLLLEGIWFAVKEALFPLLVGIAVLISSRMKRPFVATMFLNDSFLDVSMIETKIAERNTQAEFDRLLRQTTRYLSGSFFLSAILNYGLALYVFNKIDPTLAPTERAVLLNEQIARMTLLSYGVIVVPSMICVMGVLAIFLKGVRRCTGLTNKEILKENK